MTPPEATTEHGTLFGVHGGADVPSHLEIRLVVHGTPQTAGSKRAFVRGGRAIVVDDNAKSRPWKDQVRQYAAAAMNGRELLAGALDVEMHFYVLRPKGHHGAKSLNAKGRANPRPITRPDALKLARAAEDALTGVVYGDDSQIVDEHLHKHYGDPPRVEIRIRQLAPEGGTA